jgi:hypothetical protein
LWCRSANHLQPQSRCNVQNNWRRSVQYSISLNMINKSTPNSEIGSRAARSHLQRSIRTFAPPPLTGRNTLGERAVRWFLPWTVRNYPGVRRGMVELLGRRVTYSAIKGWRTGRRPMPAWVASVMADTIRARCRAGAELATELEEWAQHREKIEAQRLETRRQQFDAVRWRGRTAYRKG